MIVVSGASGQLGRLVIERLVAAGAAGRIRALSRDPARLVDWAAHGVETRRGDFDDPLGLTTAFAGGSVLLLISTNRVLEPGARDRQHRAAVAAAQTAGIGQIVYTSIPRPEPTSPIAVVPDHAATEAAIRNAGVAWTMLRNNLYAETLLSTGAVTPAGLIGNHGPGRIAYVTRDDCAAAATAVLLDPARHAGRAYDITGPAALSRPEVAALLAEVAGRPVPVLDLDDATFTARMIRGGLPPVLAELVVSFGQGARAGWLDAVATAVADLTGRPATPLHDHLLAQRPAVAAALGC